MPVPNPSPDDREIHLVDAESIAVVASHGPLQRGVGELVRAVCEPGPHDEVRVGVDPRRALDARLEFPGCNLRCQDGRHGGELAIIANLDIAHSATRFGGLTIYSGDGAFADVARRAAAAGMRVRVVSWRHRLSTDLAAAAHEIVILDHFCPGPNRLSPHRRAWRGTTNPNQEAA